MLICVINFFELELQKLDRVKQPIAMLKRRDFVVPSRVLLRLFIGLDELLNI